MMDEISLHRLLQPQDWLTVLAFFTVALFWFLAPVLGYGQGNRVLFLSILGALLIRMTLALVRFALFHFIEFDQTAGAARWGGRSIVGRSFVEHESLTGMILFFFLPPLEAGLFVLAMVLFALWLFGLQRRDRPPDWPAER